MKKVLIITVILLQINSLLAQTVNLNVMFTESSEINLTNEIKNIVYGVDLTGSIELHNENSFVEIFVVDNNNNEYLIQEFFYPLCSPDAYDITHCEEIDFMDAISVEYLKVELFNAEVELIQLNYCTSINSPIRSEALPTQFIQENKINQLNTNLSDEGFLWRAELNEYNNNYNSRPRRSTYNGSSYGFHYYNSGVFSSQSPQTIKKDNPKLTDHPVPEFDWRYQHGAMNENSPYFDDNFDTYWENGVGVVTCDQGNGWMTKIHCQHGNYGAPWDRCTEGCFAFSVINALEAKMNLYYNQHLDYNLSEQDAIDCNPYSTWNCYTGGWPYQILMYARDSGIVDEACFPYINDTTNCIGRCNNPSSKIKIDDYYEFYPNNENNIKTELIENGPMNANFFSHAMCLIGYGKVYPGLHIHTNNSYGGIDIENNSPYNGVTFWILKNSRTAADGHSGYVYTISCNDTGFDEMWGLKPMTGKIEDLLNPNLSPQILDEDNDGYYNWGIGPKPANCPPCPDEPDSDDSDAAFGPFDENYYKTVNWNNFNSDNTTESYSQNTYWYNEYIRHNTIIQSDTLFINDKSFIATNSSLTINSGAVLAVQNGELITGGEIIINGKLIINGDAGISGTMNFYDNSELIIRSNSLVNFDNGQIVLHDNAKLIFEDSATVENFNISGSGEIVFMGDHITLKDGVFDIPIQLNKNLSIDGDLTFQTVNIAQGVQIEGSLNSNNLTIRGNLNNLENVTFSNLTHNGVGGVFMEHSQPLTLDQIQVINTNFKVKPIYTNIYVENCTFNGSTLDLQHKYGRYGNATINNCTFKNTIVSQTGMQEVLRINIFSSFEVTNNVFTNNRGTAIAIYNSGDENSLIARNKISHNYYGSASSGILIYASKTSICNNDIHNNDYGISLYHNSNVSIAGDVNSIENEVYQLIYRNTRNQIFVGNNSFPWKFEYNVITETSNPYPRFYMTSTPFTPFNIAHNCWGTNFEPENDLHPFNIFIYEPVWDCGFNPGSIEDELRSVYERSVSLMNGNPEGAMVEFKTIVDTWPQSGFAARQ